LNSSESKINLNEIIEYTELAFSILQGDTTYIRSKKIISDIFKIEREDRYETIIFRLTIIDSYYSTQMNKRFFGLDDLAKKLSETTNDDVELRNICLEYITGSYNGNKIKELFDENYGIRKTGHFAGHAASLISKYLYFLTDYKFPIYDNLVKTSYRLIKRKYPQLEMSELKNSFDLSYFEKIKQLNMRSRTNDFDKLDNLLWLIGKLTEGSLSLILNKDRYLDLLGKINIKKGKESKEVDSETRKYIKENISDLTDIFNYSEIKFLKYTFELMDTDTKSY